MALTPSDLRRRKMNLLMAMSYAAFASSKASAWSPTLLFAAGEQGAWYDPSDLSTMFQDSAGTTPVTAVEQPVGLILDKSKGLALGAELVPDSDFNASASWTPETADWAVSGGRATYTKPGAGIQYLQSNDNISIVSGTWYKLTFTVSGIASGSAIFGLFNKAAAVNYLGSYQTITANGTYSAYFLATSSTTGIRIYGNASGTATSWSFESFSIKAIAGNHASQSTAASRPVLSARVNLLTYSEQFDNAAWTKQNVTVASNSVVAPNGATTADTLTDDATSGRHTAVQAVTVASGVSYTVTGRFKAGTGSFAFLCLSDAGASAYTAVLNMADGTISQTRSAGVTGASSSVTVLSGGWYLVTITCNAPASTSYVYAGMAGAATGNTFDGAGVPIYSGSGSTIYIWGADLRVTNVGVGLPAYQRVAAATDYDTSGFPLYLKFDGTDDKLVTNAFSVSNPITVFSGIRFNSTAAGYVTDSVSGTRLYNLSDGSSRQFGISAGLVNIQTIANTTNVETIVYDGASSFYRNNRTLLNSGNTGTGTVSTGLVIGAQASGTTLDGRIYSLIVRGAASTDAQIASTETYVNSKTGAY